MKLALSSDMLSPIVIKELRQELRMKSFMHFFMWPQVIMAVALLFQAISADDPSGRAGSKLFEGLFWLTFALPLLLFFA